MISIGAGTLSVSTPGRSQSITDGKPVSSGTDGPTKRGKMINKAMRRLNALLLHTQTIVRVF